MSHPLLSWRIQLWESPSVNRRSEEWAGPFVIVPFDTTCSVWLKHRGTLRPLILISKSPLTRISKLMFFDFTKLSPGHILHVALAPSSSVILNSYFCILLPCVPLKVTGKSFHFIADNCRRGRGLVVQRSLVRCNKRKWKL